MISYLSTTRLLVCQKSVLVHLCSVLVEQGAADPLLFIHIYSLSIFRFKVYGHVYGPEYVPVYGPQYVPVYGPEYGPVYGPEYVPVYGPVYGPEYGPVYGPVYGVHIMDLNELNTRVCCH